MNRSITVAGGMAASFTQPTGASRPGIDWALRISGELNTTVMVRTYTSSGTPSDLERHALAAKAVSVLAAKLDRGWRPAGDFLVVDS